MNNYADNRYKIIDRQSKRLVNTRWQAAGYSALAAAMFITAGATLIFGGLTAVTGIMAVGMMAGGIRARYLAESTRIESEIIAEDILDQREYANLSREIYRQQQLMQSRAPQYPQYSEYPAYQAPESYRAAPQEYDQPQQSSEPFVYRYNGPSFNVVKNIAPTKGTKQWTEATRQNPSQMAGVNTR